MTALFLYRTYSYCKHTYVYVETRLSYRLPTVLCIRELSFNKGDIISVIKLVDPNWYEAELNSKIGLVPSSYVEVFNS